jgi:hypothetical protein
LFEVICYLYIFVAFLALQSVVGECVHYILVLCLLCVCLYVKFEFWKRHACMSSVEFRCVCVCVCVRACMKASVCASVYVCMSVTVYVCMYVSEECVRACMCVSMHVNDRYVSSREIPHTVNDNMFTYAHTPSLAQRVPH